MVGRLHRGALDREDVESREAGEDRGHVLGIGRGRARRVRDHERLGEEGADELAGVLGLGQLDARGETGAGHVALQRALGGRVAELRLQADDAADAAAGLGDQSADLIHQLRGHLLAAGDQEDGPAVEASVDQRRRDRLLERIGAVHLRGQGLRLVLQLPLVLLQLVHPRLDVGGDRVVERRRPDDDAERDREEDRDQRDEMVTEVDHEKRFSNQNTKLFHWSISRPR
jgi:hypothetical protein